MAFNDVTPIDIYAMTGIGQLARIWDENPASREADRAWHRVRRWGMGEADVPDLLAASRLRAGAMIFGALLGADLADSIDVPDIVGQVKDAQNAQRLRSRVRRTISHAVIAAEMNTDRVPFSIKFMMENGASPQLIAMLSGDRDLQHKVALAVEEEEMEEAVNELVRGERKPHALQYFSRWAVTVGVLAGSGVLPEELDEMLIGPIDLGEGVMANLGDVVPNSKVGQYLSLSERDELVYRYSDTLINRAMGLISLSKTTLEKLVPESPQLNISIGTLGKE